MGCCLNEYFVHRNVLDSGHLAVDRDGKILTRINRSGSRVIRSPQAATL